MHTRVQWGNSCCSQASPCLASLPPSPLHPSLLQLRARGGPTMACPPPLAPRRRWCPRANPYIDSPSHSSLHMKIEAMNPVVPSHKTTPSLLPPRHSLPPSRQSSTVVSSFGQARMHQVGILHRQATVLSTDGIDLWYGA